MTTSEIVSKVWNYAHILRDDGAAMVIMLNKSPHIKKPQEKKYRGEISKGYKPKLNHTLNNRTRYNPYSRFLYLGYNDITNYDAGWSSLVARRAHNPKVVGSNPTPATTFQIKYTNA